MTLGLRANAAQFTLLVAINALVGGMVGQQQTVLPLLAEDEFGLTGYTFIFTYVVAFGISKAAANYVAGTWSDRYGRKPVLIVGWLFAVPVPLMLIWAPSWGWVVAANVLLGINQGLTWSTTVIMKIDLVGPSATRPGDGTQRGRRVRRRRPHLARRGLPRRRVRPAPRAVPARSVLHRPRPRAVDACGAGDPRARPRRGRGPCRRGPTVGTTTCTAS